MLVSLTVGKVDAGVTVLLTEDKRLIEFPSILLPPNITSGSIVDITVGRNRSSEQTAQDRFGALQMRIYETFGVAGPTAPVLRCRNATQTSVVLEWDPIELATADLLSLALYRNGQKAGTIPRPRQMHSTKISGLAVDMAYTFYLVLRTSAGTFASEKLEVRTHKMTDLSGITITTGLLQPAAVRERLAAAVERIGAKLVPEPGVVRIDTTHFVTTEGRGLAWEKATELSIPVVRPEWVEACEKSGRILGVTKYYLDAVRPTGPSDGPTTVTTATTATAATAATPSEQTTPSPPPAPQQKELPATPEADNTKTEENGGTDAEANARDELSTRDELPPPSAETDEDEDEEDEDAEKHEGDNEAGSRAKPATPGGDGSSFQDVAL